MKLEDRVGDVTTHYRQSQCIGLRWRELIEVPLPSAAGPLVKFRGAR